MEPVPRARWQQFQFLQPPGHSLERDMVEVAECEYIRRSYRVVLRPPHRLKTARQPGCGHEKEAGKGIGEPLILRNPLVKIEDSDLRFEAVGQKMRILMD